MVERGKLLEQCRQMFDAFDKDDSGSIDALELKDAMKELGYVMTDGEIVDLLLVLGAGQDGTIDFPIFLKLCLNRAQVMDQRWQRKAETMDAFHAVGGESDGSGRADHSKIKQAMESFEMQIDVIPLVESLDKDHDGSIDFAEFAEFLRIENEDVDTNLHRPGNRWLRHSMDDVMEIHKTANLNLVTKERDFPRTIAQRQVEAGEDNKSGEEKDPFGRLKWLDQLDRQFHAKIRSNRQKESDKRRKALKVQKQPSKKEEDSRAITSLSSKSKGLDNESSNSSLGAPSPTASPGGPRSRVKGKKEAELTLAQQHTKEQKEQVKETVMAALFPPPRMVSFRNALDSPKVAGTRDPFSGMLSKQPHYMSGTGNGSPGPGVVRHSDLGQHSPGSKRQFPLARQGSGSGGRGSSRHIGNSPGSSRHLAATATAAGH
mmetsp:Transcript_44156/g.90128  ORF Transcript_44156/g.90128 Transcript_44156/m.90128 type:complete len:431 (+) Transcript_44156:339-1631(+)